MIRADCLLAEELRALRDGRLDADAEEGAIAHLDECRECDALYYELPERPASDVRALSETEIGAFAERLKARVTESFAADRSSRAKVVSFANPSWSGLRLAAHGGAARPLMVSPSDGVRVLETDDLEVRVVEFQGEGQKGTDGTLVLVEATLMPTTDQEFATTTDVTVTDEHGHTLEPLDVFVRPLVWTGTFAGSGIFEIRIRSRVASVRVEIQRPR